MSSSAWTIGCNGLGGKVHGRGANGFVGVLGVLLLLEPPRLGGQGVASEGARDVGADGGEGFVGHASGVRTHVGDETHRAAVAHWLAFVEALGDLHGPTHGEAEGPGRGLLELGGGERWDGMTSLFASLHCDDLEIGRPNVGQQFLGRLTGGEARIGTVELQLLVTPNGDSRRERSRTFREDHRNGEVGDRNEPLPLRLPFDDDA